MSTGIHFFLSHRNSDKQRLRPIVLRMLDAGIPLWIDLPEKILKDERLAQVGKIPFGAYWADEVERAVTQDESYLLFCWSKKAARRFKSKGESGRGGLRWELEQGLAQRRIVGVQLDRTPLTALPSEALDIHWADLSGFRAGHPSEVFNRLLAEMTRKVEDSQARLARKTRTQASERQREFETRQTIEKPDMSFAVYEVDRTGPFERASELVEESIMKSKPARPLIVVGPDDEAPDMFLERCRRAMPKTHGAAMPILRLEWTRDADFAGSYRRRLSHGLTGRSGATLEDLAHLLADQGRAGQSCAVASFIEASSWDKEERGRIEAWAAFWAELQVATAGAGRILPVLCVWMAPAHKPWREKPPTPRGQAVSNDKIIADLRRLDSVSVVAGPLSPFALEQALPWRDRIRDELGGTSPHALTASRTFDKVFETERRGQAKLVSMHTFAAALNPALTRGQAD